MPTKYGRDTWNNVRHEFNVQLREGKDIREAAQAVSDSRGGRPAAGTILNYYNNGWQTPSVKAPDTADVQVLKDQLAEMRRHIARMTETLDETTAELAESNKEILRLREDNAVLREARARAEGRAEVATDVIREVADIDVRGNDVMNANGHPAI